MSEMQMNRGELREYDLGPESLEWAMKNILVNHGYTPQTFEGSYEDQFRSELYDDYVLVNNKIYCIIQNKEIMTSNGYQHALRQPNGIIKFDVYFYNGGAGLQEVIEAAVKELLESEK